MLYPLSLQLQLRVSEGVWAVCSSTADWGASPQHGGRDVPTTEGQWAAQFRVVYCEDGSRTAVVGRTRGAAEHWDTEPTLDIHLGSREQGWFACCIVYDYRLWLYVIAADDHFPGDIYNRRTNREPVAVHRCLWSITQRYTLLLHFCFVLCALRQGHWIEH